MEKEYVSTGIEFLKKDIEMINKEIEAEEEKKDGLFAEFINALRKKIMKVLLLEAPIALIAIEVISVCNSEAMISALPTYFVSAGILGAIHYPKLSALKKKNDAKAIKIDLEIKNKKNVILEKEKKIEKIIESQKESESIKHYDYVEEDLADRYFNEQIGNKNVVKKEDLNAKSNSEMNLIKKHRENLEEYKMLLEFLKEQDELLSDKPKTLKR